MRCRLPVSAPRFVHIETRPHQLAPQLRRLVLAEPGVELGHGAAAAQLDARPEDSGTMLDNSLVLLCTEICDGNTHGHDDMPFLLAGGGAGTISISGGATFSATSASTLSAAMIVGAGVTDIDSVRSSLTSTAVAKDDAKLYGAGIVDAAKAVARAHWLHLALRLVALVGLFALIASRIKKQGGEDAEDEFAGGGRRVDRRALAGQHAQADSAGG